MLWRWLMPEAWSTNENMDPAKKAFYEFHSSLMEPWDGPAAIAFTDGRVIGATLDRNGLRPARYEVTNDGLIVMASETGVLPTKPSEVKLKGRLQPGKMLLVDTVAGKIVSDSDLKAFLASQQPYQEWIEAQQIRLEDLPVPPRTLPADHVTLRSRQRAFGYTDEDLKTILIPMASNGEEPVGSMGNDTPPACLSDKPQRLFDYFKQLFCTSDQPSDRSDSRGHGHVAHELHRHRAEHPQRVSGALPHAKDAASDSDEPRSGKAPSSQPRLVPGDDHPIALPGRRRREGLGASSRKPLPQGVVGY